jgi:pyruvate kinase
LIIIDDGYTVTTVREIKEKSVIVELMNDATIGEVDNLSIPG